MAKRAPSLAEIHSHLERAAKELSEANRGIVAAKLGPGRNVYRIGQALGIIFDIQADIYRADPNLLPKMLYDTKFGAEVLSNRAVEKDVRRKRPRASHRRR